MVNNKERVNDTRVCSPCDMPKTDTWGRRRDVHLKVYLIKERYHITSRGLWCAICCCRLNLDCPRTIALSRGDRGFNEISSRPSSDYNIRCTAWFRSVVVLLFALAVTKLIVLNYILVWVDEKTLLLCYYFLLSLQILLIFRLPVILLLKLSFL